MEIQFFAQVIGMVKNRQAKGSSSQSSIKRESKGRQAKKHLICARDIPGFLLKRFKSQIFCSKF